jgi:hypothetical protein
MERTGREQEEPFKMELLTISDASSKPKQTRIGCANYSQQQKKTDCPKNLSCMRHGCHRLSANKQNATNPQVSSNGYAPRATAQT